MMDKNQIKRKDKMNYLRKLAGITSLFVFVFMIIALFGYQMEGEEILSDQVEYYFNEDWTVAFLDSTKLTKEEQTNQKKKQEYIRTALAEMDSQKVTLPYKKERETFDWFIFKNVLSKEYAGFTIYFSSIDANVCVTLDKEVIYQYEIQEDISETFGIREHFFTIPDVFQNGELWIELTFPYPDTEVLFQDVKIGSHDFVMVGLLGNNIVDIGCCLLIMFAAIVMFALASIRWYTKQPSRGEFFLGLVGLISSVYCFIETGTLDMFYNIQEAYQMREYFLLLLPLFLVLYFEKNLYKKYPRRFSFLLCLVSLHAVLQILLEQFKVQVLEDMIKVSVIIIGVVLFAALISLIQFDYKNKFHQTGLPILSIVILLLGGIVNIFINIIYGSIHIDTVGQYSVTLFHIIMAVAHVLQLAKEYRFSVEEKVKEADAAKQEAMSANEAKGKFLAHMSHEIRTPINAVLGMDEMILRESNEQQIKEYAMDIYLAVQTLLSLINDILDFSKIDSGKMEIVPVEYDMSSLIYDLFNMISQRAKDKNLQLEVEVDPMTPSKLYGDDVRIRQVLTNILTNAVKYTQEGTVWLRVQSRRLDSKVILKFEVEDTGIGIKEEDLPKLSAEFERIEEDRNRNIEGSGLGMSITIQLLILLGSKLQVESSYGKGSKFYFELEQKIVNDTPIGDFESRVHKITEDYHYQAKFCAPDAKILVVDDNAVNRKVLRNLLKETQIQIAEAEGGMACFELVQKNHYDLILLDHMMPEMDGIETLHRIRKLSDFPCKDTPIVVLTANAVSGAKEAYLAEGFDDFLSKPIIPEKLESLIKQLLPEELQQIRKESKQSVVLPQERSENFLEELPAVEGLDWQYAWLHLPEKELLEYTIKEFYAQINPAADCLEQSYKQIAKSEQLESYRIQVHAMKSLAATIGIVPLAGMAKILEYAAKDKKIDTIQASTMVFLEEWRSYNQKLKGVFGIGIELKKEVTDVSIIQALIEMVRISMQEMDIDQADQCIHQLQEYQYPDKIDQIMQKLAEAVTNLDSEKTDYLADQLLEQMTIG